MDSDKYLQELYDLYLKRSMLYIKLESESEEINKNNTLNEIESLEEKIKEIKETDIEDLKKVLKKRGKYL